MITTEVLQVVRDELLKSPLLPPRFEYFTWGLVPAHVKEVSVPVEKPSPIVSHLGGQYRGEPETVRIVLSHQIPLTGVPHVRGIRFGFDAEAEVVAWCVE